MRNASHVFDTFNSDIQAGKRADGRIAAQTDSFYEDVGARHTVLLLGRLACPFGCDLGCICSTLFGTAEATGSGATGGQDAAASIGKCDNRIIEGSQHMDLAAGDGPLGFLTLGCSVRCFCHNLMSYLLLS